MIPMSQNRVAKVTICGGCWLAVTAVAAEKNNVGESAKQRR